MLGSVSGGCVETDVFERAMQVLEDGEPVIQSYGIRDTHVSGHLHVVHPANETKPVADPQGFAVVDEGGEFRTIT